MKSGIQFTDIYSTTSVNFLDTVVKVEGDHLITDLFIKSTAAHDYVQRSSYHPQHSLRAIPKGQFIRLRRICTHLSDYRKHAETFITFFRQRGYSETDLRKIANSVQCHPREDYLTYKKKSDESVIPLVLTYHHKTADFSNILRNCYSSMITRFPDMKDIFPRPPLVSYRRPRNLRNWLVKSRHSASSPPTAPTNSNNRSELQPFMNQSGTITNSKSGISVRIPRGSATDKGVVYAVRCTKHDLISVGVTSTKLNERTNRHRSDIKLRPDSTELDQHFARNDCDFSRDIEVSVLSKVTGGMDKLMLEEDRWITWLDTKSPKGINERLSSYGTLFYDLFGI